MILATTALNSIHPQAYSAKTTSCAPSPSFSATTIKTNTAALASHPFISVLLGAAGNLALAHQQYQVIDPAWSEEAYFTLLVEDDSFALAVRQIQETALLQKAYAVAQHHPAIHQLLLKPILERHTERVTPHSDGRLEHIQTIVSGIQGMLGRTEAARVALEMLGIAPESEAGSAFVTDCAPL